ncbi:arabinosyltransferase domain-containing protein [Corynebacterium kozikiae]|uniref:arabinosyltransferase domain-containing protein n=1 Tax=Corynebacterium kozikiae TaxID=2968469 RepID=UPI00359CB1D7
MSTQPAPSIPAAAVPDRRGNVGRLKLWATITGLLGFVLFLATPFMPVIQTQSWLNWPQGQGSNSVVSVNAPLVSYSPRNIEVSVPISAVDNLREGQTMIVGTLPPTGPNALNRGLFVRSFDGGIDVLVRENLLLEFSAEELAALPRDAVLEVRSTEQETTASLGSESAQELGDARPQLTGVYSELEQSVPGLALRAEIESRFTSSPSALKYASMILGTLSMLASLILLARMDALDRNPHHSFRPLGSWRPRPLDGVVAFVLGFWHIFGANTSDDGFILTMAKAAQESTYMANYYRWFGVPESPFGAPYYNLLGWMTEVSSASTWMRLPALLSGLLIWFVLSREVLPRLGEKIDGRQVAHWSAAFLFLAFWMAYNNGLRPEPIIAAGALLAWVSFERAIATSRLLPAAVGTIIAAFTLACGPTGLMAVAALLASLSGIIRIIYHRLPLLNTHKASSEERSPGLGATLYSVTAMVAPFLAAGTSVFVAVFGDQTLRTVLESIAVRDAKGPSLSWYNEPVRYEVLMQQTVDGSFSRRFAVIFAFACIALVVASMLRNGKVPGSNKGPALRLLLMMLGTLFFMMFTPTKWTHHFGVWAGIAGALAALAAVALSHIALRSPRARTLLIGGSLFLFAFALSGTNGWWYVSSYGIPWFDKTIQINAIEASSVMLLISLVVLALGALQSFKQDVQMAQAEERGENPETVVEQAAKRSRKSWLTGLASAPIAVLCILSVTFYMASFAKAFADQAPAYSVGMGNLRTFTGNTCGLANDILVEVDTNESLLTPVNSTLGDSLEADTVRGFEANRVPNVITQDFVASTLDSAMTDAVNDEEESEETTDADQTASSDTSGGVRSSEGINGSNVTLPFGLDYREVPVLGSWTAGEQFTSEVTTDWYRLPERRADQPLITLSAAGRIEHVDINGVTSPGQKLVLEYGNLGASGEVEVLGEAMMSDAGPQPTWRNLRLPIADLPEEANVVRIQAADTSLDPDQWLAFTPPRVPTMQTINEFVGSEAPVLLDWAVPLQFPCQRPFSHYAGVAENPEFRISPDTGGKATGTPFQDWAGGGVMGPAQAINDFFELPSYANHDWKRDWGSIEVLVPRANSVGERPEAAELELEEITRSGLWNPGHMNITTK